MIRKAHDNDHYANAILKYACKYAVSITDICSFVCYEPNFPLTKLPSGRRVGDHDSSTISLILTVILISYIPEYIDKSWNPGKACVGIEISATDLSTALWNAVEVANVLI